MRPLFACIAIISVCASSASAALQAFWQANTISPAAIADAPALANMQSWSLMISHTDGDWSSAGVRLTLPAGFTFWHHPLGGNTKPNPAFVTLFPGMAHDTYVTGPADTGTSGAPAILGGHPASPTADFGGSSGIFSVSWGDLETTPPGTYEIARITFPQGSIPSVYWEFDGQGNPTLPNSSHTSQVNPAQTVIIPIPEPTALGLFLAAGLLATRCRRI